MTTKKPSDKKKTDAKNLEKKIKEMEEEINKIKEELKIKNDKYLRSCADFQNYKNRIEKEYEFNKTDVVRKYLEELFEIYELLKKAIEDKKPQEGLNLIIQNMNNFFEKEEIKCIETIGREFDHNLHHAVTTIEKKDCKENEIVDEIKKGYKMKNKVIKPAQVVVAKKSENKEV